MASAEDDGEQPSRFLAELGVTVEQVEGRPRPAAVPGGAGQRAAAHRRRPGHRRAAPRRGRPPAGPPGGRDGRRPGTGAAGRPVRPGGAPAPRPDRSQPVRDPDQPVPVSASMLEHVMTCPTQWFLMTEAGGAGPAHQSANIGQLVHALAQRVAVGEVAPDLDLLMRHVDEVWGRLHFRTPWSAAREHERIEVALDPLPRVARRQPAHAGRHRGAVRDRRRARERRAGHRSSATPTGSSSTPTAASWWSTSRPPRTQPTGPAASSGTSSSGSTSTPSTTAPSTRLAPDGHGGVRRRRARPARPARRRRGGGAAAAGVRRRRPRAHRAAGSSWTVPPRSCGPRPSRPSPATTAATATSRSICPIQGAGSVTSR